MDSKDFKSACMIAGGAAMCAASTAVMYAAPQMTSLEAVTDLAQLATIVAGVLGTGGAIVAAIGLVPLLWKYGEKFYKLVKQKLQEKYNMSSKDADKAMHKAISKETKSSSKGNMKDNMKVGYNRGAPINTQSRRSARNPVNRAPSSRVTTSTRQAVH